MDEQNENLQPISAEELKKQEEQAEVEKVETEEPTHEEEKTKETVDTQDEAPAEEKGGEAPDAVGEDAEQLEDVSDDVVKEEKEETTPEEKEEEETVEEEKVEEVNPEVEELRKQVEEFQFEKEEQAGIQELQHAVNDAQVSFADFEARVNAALRDALEDNKIDLNKSLEEIRQENPAQYKVAIDYINQAEAIKQKHIAEATQKIQDVQNRLIFKRAEREFNKFELTNEEAEIAADTFINIMRQVGISNLTDDLKAKVSLAVGQGKLLAKGVKETAKKVADVAEAVEKKAAEVEENLKEKVEEAPAEVEEVAEEVEKIEEEVVKDATKEEALAEAMDDPTAVNVDSNAPNKIDDPDILSKLAGFKQGSKEQLAFYKEHYAEINKAMLKFRRGE